MGFEGNARESFVTENNESELGPAKEKELVWMSEDEEDGWMRNDSRPRSSVGKMHTEIFEII